MSDKIKVRVQSSIFAGNRIWNAGIYPNDKNPDASVLIKLAEEFEKKNIPLKARAVVFCGESVEKKVENPLDGVNGITNPHNNENGGEPPINANNNDGVNTDNTDDDGESDETEYLSIDAFSKLKAKEQKEYVQALYENEDVDYDTFYKLASDYMQVVESTMVKNYIDKCFAEMEEESENEDE